MPESSLKFVYLKAGLLVESQYKSDRCCNRSTQSRRSVATACPRQLLIWFRVPRCMQCFWSSLAKVNTKIRIKALYIKNSSSFPCCTPYIV